MLLMILEEIKPQLILRYGATFPEAMRGIFPRITVIRTRRLQKKWT